MINWAGSCIDSSRNASDIVRENYRTAEIFNKYGIEFCCGIKWPIKMICENRGIELDDLLRELNEVNQVIKLPSRLPFNEWRIDFITEYISNVHHHYLLTTFPLIGERLAKFTEEHKKKYPAMIDLLSSFKSLQSMMIPHIKQEEGIIFPYIKQIAHAYESKEPYARLLVRTLRKPVEALMNHEHDYIEKILTNFRNITNNYQPPESACTNHKLSFNYLKELDDDLVQHIYLENQVLFPKAIAMEKALLENN